MKELQLEEGKRGVEEKQKQEKETAKGELEEDKKNCWLCSLWLPRPV